MPSAGFELSDIVTWEQAPLGDKLPWRKATSVLCCYLTLGHRDLRTSSFGEASSHGERSTQSVGIKALDRGSRPLKRQAAASGICSGTEPSDFGTPPQDEPQGVGRALPLVLGYLQPRGSLILCISHRTCVSFHMCIVGGLPIGLVTQPECSSEDSTSSGCWTLARARRRPWTTGQASNRRGRQCRMTLSRVGLLPCHKSWPLRVRPAGARGWLLSPLNTTRTKVAPPRTVPSGKHSPNPCLVLDHL